MGCDCPRRSGLENPKFGQECRGKHYKLLILIPRRMHRRHRIRGLCTRSVHDSERSKGDPGRSQSPPAWSPRAGSLGSPGRRFSPGWTGTFTPPTLASSRIRSEEDPIVAYVRYLRTHYRICFVSKDTPSTRYRSQLTNSAASSANTANVFPLRKKSACIREAVIASTTEGFSKELGRSILRNVIGAGSWFREGSVDFSPNELLPVVRTWLPEKELQGRRVCRTIDKRQFSFDAEFSHRHQ